MSTMQFIPPPNKEEVINMLENYANQVEEQKYEIAKLKKEAELEEFNNRFRLWDAQSKTQ